MWRKGNTFALLVGMQSDAAIVENSMEIPQKIKNGSAFWPSNPTSGNIPQETQNANLEEHRHPCVHCSIIYSLQDIEGTQVSISLWVDKTTMGHLCNGILLSCNKQNLTLVTAWMDLENIMLSEISHSEKNKYYMISLLCGI